MTREPLRILITNQELWPLSGTVLYVRDLALELRRQGHVPVVFSLTIGEVVRELREAGVLVTDRLRHLDRRPDIIQGHHHAQTMAAVRNWPDVPAVSVCHDHTSPLDRTPFHPRIRRYAGVSRVCVARQVADGVPSSKTGLALNWVDTDRFRARDPLPARPRRALVFSNYAHSGNYLPAVQQACADCGLALDVVGISSGQAALRPEAILGRYDIVFAKAKAAIEAMAVGTAVVLCDSAGLGPMVLSDAFDALRPMNFGFEALAAPISPSGLVQEILRYDAVDAARVRDRVRAEASLPGAVERLTGLYRDVIAEHRRSGVDPHAYEEPRSLREQLYMRMEWAWLSMPAERRRSLRSLGAMRVLLRAFRRTLAPAGR